MGMSPRIKAKKGRFGAGGTDPILNVVSFPSELTTAVANTLDFVANASDPVDGDLSAIIDWVSDLDAVSVGTGATPAITLTALGLHTITVSVVAPTGAQLVSSTIEVLVVAA